MKDILFLLQNLNGGGAERVVVNLLNNLEKKKYNKTLLLLENKGQLISNLKYLDKKVVYKDLLKNRNLNFLINFFKSLLYIFKNKQDIIFTQYHPGKILSFFIPILSRKVKYIYRETNLPQDITKISKTNIRILDKFFYRYGIKNYTIIVVQSMDMRDKLLNLVPNISEKIVLINNPLDCENINKRLSEKSKNINTSNEKLKLISVGRLNIQKGYDILIKSLTQIKDINYELQILGIGEEEENLKRLIKGNKLEKKIKLVGFKENPYLYMKSADFFISSSRFEGFPNAVLEANYCGLPVIANNYKGGINEIIETGINGEIIDISDSEQLRNALLKKYDSLKIKTRIKEKYNVNTIIKKYEEIF